MSDTRYSSLMGTVISRDANLAADLAMLNKARKNRDLGFFGSYVDATYDSSSDYWKLKKDGTLVFDKRASLTIENPDGSLTEVGYEDFGLKNDKQVEGALAKILGVDTLSAQKIMSENMGLVHSGGKPDQWIWNDKAMCVTSYFDAQGKHDIPVTYGDLNFGKGMSIGALSADIQYQMNSNMRDNLMYSFANSVSTKLFNEYYDAVSTRDVAANMGKNLQVLGAKEVYNSGQSRYANLVSSKTSFVESFQSHVNRDDGYYNSNDFGEKYKNHYADFKFKHFGIDLALKSGTSQSKPIYAGIAGVLLDKDYTVNNGNYAKIDIAYQFENQTFSTGIIQQYLHMEKMSELIENKYYPSNTLVGNIGNTGSSDGPHLHFTFRTDGSSYNKPMVGLLFGNDWDQTSFTSTGGWTRVYDPKSYYKEWLNYTFPKTK